jgi:aquaporin Z
VSAALLRTWAAHWPEYLIEAWALGTFMLSAAAFGVLLEWPGSPVRAALADADLRRALGGLAMGATAIALIHSAWGRRSGAHMNPAVTLAFALLGRVRPADAAGYVVAQFAGGLAGVLLAAAAFGSAFTDSPVAYVQTLPAPGAHGVAVALVAETLISGGLLATVLVLSGRAATAAYAGHAAGLLVALYIAFEAPLSGMSMNPARTVASALPAGRLDTLWIYFVGPCAGMAAAAAAWQLLQPRGGCAKLVHTDDVRCIHCGHEPGTAAPDAIVTPTPLASDRS